MGRVFLGDSGSELRHPHWDHSCRGQPFKMATGTTVEFKAWVWYFLQGMIG